MWFRQRVNVNSSDETTMTENTTMAEGSAKIRGGFNSRDRRKSKYLSYPYTNIGSIHKELASEREELRTPCLSNKTDASSIGTNPLNGTPSFIKVGNKRFRRNWYKKFISSSTMSSSPEFINASSGELLSGLYSKAVDCMSPVEDKNFDLVEWFFCKYRVSQYHDEAELATCLVDVEGGGIGKHVDNDLLDIKSEKRRNNKMKNVVKRKMKSLSGLSDINIGISTRDSLSPVSKLNKKRKVEEVTSLHQPQDVEITLNESSSNYSSVPEAPQTLTCLTSEGKTETERKENTKAEQEHQRAQIASVYTDAKCTKCSSLVMDLQLISPPDLQLISPPIPSGIPEKSTVENKDEQVLISSNPEFCISQDGLVGNSINHSLLVSDTSEVGIVSLNKIGLNNRMKKAAEEEHLNTKLAIEIPDLNVSSESNSIRKEFCETVNIISPELKRSRHLSACLSPTKTFNHNIVEDNGTCLLLQFSPEVLIPSKEDLLRAFFRFGPLKASETQLLKDTHSAQIVFVRSADAGKAFHSLEQNKPFGAALVDYRLHHLSAAGPLVERFVAPTQPTASIPVPSKAPPSLQFIRQNLQMMASVMENSGNNLSPRMRANLENEINNLMKKVNSRANI